MAKNSKAFETYKVIADEVRENSPKVAATGENVITVSSLMPSKNQNAKGDQIFYLNSKSGEALQFTLSVGGKLRSAKYIDKTAEEGSKAVFLAKDIDKMHEVVKDPALAKFASQMDWTKVEPAAEAEAEAEAEAAEPEV